MRLGLLLKPLMSLHFQGCCDVAGERHEKCAVSFCGASYGICFSLFKAVGASRGKGCYQNSTTELELYRKNIFSLFILSSALLIIMVWSIKYCRYRMLKFYLQEGLQDTFYAVLRFAYLVFDLLDRYLLVSFVY